MYFDVKFYYCNDEAPYRHEQETIRVDSYYEALMESGINCSDFDLAMVFDSHGQYIISRSSDGELCREDEL